MLVALSFIQLVYVILFAPLIVGILSTVEEKMESKAGPTIFQPYYDLHKLFTKENVVPKVASGVFRIGPYINFALYMLIIIILPIITAFPLAFGPTADFIGGGLIFGAAGIIKKIVALDSRNNYSHLGTARASSIGALSEPITVLLFILCGVISNTNNPYVINNVFQTSSSWYFSVVHIFIAATFFMNLIVETGKLPIEAKTHGEFGMIDQSMEMEFSGSDLAVYKWGGYIKQFLLMSVFLNVYACPFWVPMKYTSLSAVFIYSGIHLLKMFTLVIIFAFINETVSKYRLYKIFDYIAVTFSVILIGMLAIYAANGIF